MMTKSLTQESLNQLVEDLRSLHGDNLASVVLYGSAAAGDQIESRSDYNLLIALNRITPEELRLAQDAMRKWHRLGHPLPVYFTVEELADAADVFPIEFYQMENARIVLYGQDPFEFVKLTDTNLRHQTEYELRTKLIQLRGLYITASVSAEKLCNLMGDSLASFAALFRAVLILHRKDAPVSKSDCVRATVQLLKLESEPFETILGFRESVARPSSEKEADEVFAAYMDQIVRVVEVVDRLDGSSSRRTPDRPAASAMNA